MKLNDIELYVELQRQLKTTKCTRTKRELIRALRKIRKRIIKEHEKKEL